METELQRLLALEAIRELRSRYCHYLDTNRMDALAELFTEDAICQVDRGTWQGRQAIRDGLANAFKAYDLHQRGTYPFLHAVTNHWVALLGPDHAEGRCYLIDMNASRPASANPLLLLATYADEYRRVDKCWQISRTRLDVVWPVPEVGGGLPGDGLLLPS
jgi:hypothetical protein